DGTRFQTTGRSVPRGHRIHGDGCDPRRARQAMKAVCELRHLRYVIVADELSSRACGRTSAYFSASADDHISGNSKTSRPENAACTQTNGIHISAVHRIDVKPRPVVAASSPNDSTQRGTTDASARHGTSA